MKTRNIVPPRRIPKRRRSGCVSASLPANQVLPESRQVPERPATCPGSRDPSTLVACYTFGAGKLRLVGFCVLGRGSPAPPYWKTRDGEIWSWAAASASLPFWCTDEPSIEAKFSLAWTIETNERGTENDSPQRVSWASCWVRVFLLVVNIRTIESFGWPNPIVSSEHQQRSTTKSSSDRKLPDQAVSRSNISSEKLQNRDSPKMFFGNRKAWIKRRLCWGNRLSSQNELQQERTKLRLDAQFKVERQVFGRSRRLCQLKRSPSCNIGATQFSSIPSRKTARLGLADLSCVDSGGRRRRRRTSDFELELLIA